MNRFTLCSAVAIAAGILSAAPVMAQEANTNASAEADAAPIGEIIVTAQKRSESAMKVPISLNVVGGVELQKRGVVSLAEIASSLPAFKIADATVSNKIYIRGIGSGQNLSFEQSVGTFVDGVYRGRSKLSQAAMFDLERVEVLKGPQSTYFGNNTIAGAISIISRNPTNKFEVSGEGLYSPAHGERSIQGIVSGPISKTLKARVALKYYGMDGWMKNTFTGGKAPQEETFAGRATLVWEPTEDFDATLKAEIVRSDSEGGAMFQMTHCPPDPVFTGGAKGHCAAALAASLAGTLPNFETNFDRNYSNSPGQKGYLDMELVSLTMNQNLGEHTLTSITSYSNHDAFLPIDADQSGLDRANNAIGDGYTQVSQELRIASPSDRRLTYIFGAYYHHGKLRGDVSLFSFVAGPPYAGTNFVIDQDEDAFSAFGSLNWHVTDSISINPGLRWSTVSKRAHRLKQSGTVGAVGFDLLSNNITTTAVAFDRYDTRSDNDFTPSVKLQFKPSETVMLYAAYARGFKAGGLDALPPANALTDFGSETVNAFELGAKVSAFDRRLQLSAALFQSNFSGLQQSVFTGGTPPFTTQNVGKAVSRGIELEGSFAILNNLKLSGSLTILDAFFKDFPNGQCSEYDKVTIAGCTVRSYNGRVQPYAPDYSGSVGLNYETDIFSNLKLSASTVLAFTGGFYTETDLDPFTYQKAYQKVDARIGISDRDDHWNVAVIGKNLTNEYTTQWSSDTAGSPGTYFRRLDRTRSVAIQIGFKY